MKKLKWKEKDGVLLAKTPFYNFYYRISQSQDGKLHEVHIKDMDESYIDHFEFIGNSETIEDSKKCADKDFKTRIRYIFRFNKYIEEFFKNGKIKKLSWSPKGRKHRSKTLIPGFGYLIYEKTIDEIRDESYPRFEFYECEGKIVECFGVFDTLKEAQKEANWFFRTKVKEMIHHKKQIEKWSAK